MNYLLIWDVDGTLIRTKGIGKRAMNRAFYKLFGIEDGFSTINMAGMLDSIIVKTALELHNIPAVLPDGSENEDIQNFFDLYIEILSLEIKKVGNSIACPGVLKVLEILRQQGVFFNVLGTGNIEEGARLKLSIDNLNRHFPTGGFGEQEMERWQLIEKAIVNSKDCFQKDFQKDKIYVIGDTPKDIECGRKLDIKSIGIATGPYKKDLLSESGADHVFENLSDINSFLDIF